MKDDIKVNGRNSQIHHFWSQEIAPSDAPDFNHLAVSSIGQFCCLCFML